MRKEPLEEAVLMGTDGSGQGLWGRGDFRPQRVEFWHEECDCL